MRDGGVIIGATIALAAFAWHAGVIATPLPKCEQVRVVEYFALPEPAPLIKTPPLGWPVEDRMLEQRDEPVVEKAVAKDEPSADERPRRHYRRHWRR